MPKLLNIRTGEEEEVSEYKLGEYLATGEFQFDPGETYRLRNPEGTLVELTGKGASHALQNMDFRLPMEAEREAELAEVAREEQYGGIAGGVAAAGAGLARGATAGLSDIALGGLGYAEPLRGFEEEHPGVSTAAEIVGVVGPALLSGGATLGAQAARALPAGAIARAGGRIIAKGAGRPLTTRVARGAAGWGFEGGLYSSGQYVSDVALEKRDLSAEAFLGEMGEGVLWGGGLGGAFTVAGAGLARLRPKRVVEELGTLGRAKTLRLEPGQEGALQGALAKEAKAEALVAKRGKAAAARAERAAIVEAKKEARRLVKLDKLTPKRAQGLKNSKVAHGKFRGAVSEHKAVGAELREIADAHVAAGPMSPRGPHYHRKLVAEIENSLKPEVARFDAWLAQHGKPFTAAGPGTMIQKQKFLALAEEAGDVLGAAKPEMLESAALLYGKRIARGRRAGFEAGPTAARKAMGQRPAEQEIFESLKRIAEYQKQIAKAEGVLAKAAPKVTAAAKKAARKQKAQATAKLNAEQKAVVEAQEAAARRPVSGKRRDEWGWTIKSRPDAQDRLLDEAFGAARQERRIVAPGGKLPLAKIEDLMAGKGITPVDRLAVGEAGTLEDLSAIWTKPTVVPKGVSTAAGKRAAMADQEAAAAYDAIGGSEAAQASLYKTLKPHLEPATTARLDPHFEKFEKAAAKVAKDTGRFRTFKDALGAAEALQMAGVPGIPDVGKVPVLGPVLDAYAKWRLLRLAGRKVKALRTADSNVAERGVKIRNRLADGVDRFLEGAKKARPIAVPSAVSILSSPLFEGGIDTERRREGKKERAARKGLTAAELFKQRAGELRAAQRAGAAAFRKMVNVSDPEMQQVLEASWKKKIDYLVSKLPTDPRLPNQLGLVSQWQPGPSDLHEFAQFVRGADGFANIVEDLENGSLTPQAVEAFRTVAPGVYAEMREYLINRRAELQTDLKYDQRVYLSILFEAPLDPSMEPQYILTQQEAFQKEEEPSQPQPSLAGPGLGAQAMWGAHGRSGK